MLRVGVRVLDHRGQLIDSDVGHLRDVLGPAGENQRVRSTGHASDGPASPASLSDPARRGSGELASEHRRREQRAAAAAGGIMPGTRLRAFRVA
ncbi:MAG: hypothetical protein JO243_12175 [Solirubrobacterales bacterium]|nr:hypothetical protein [Solirubrobacterales bacterium]